VNPRDTDRRSPSARPGDLTVWLGGGAWRDIDEPGERAGYQATGLVVLLGALVAWAVSAGALVAVGTLGWLVAIPVTVVVGLLAGAQGRVLAAAPARRGTLAGLGLFAALTGVLLGELAALILFAGSLAPYLDARAERDAATAVEAGAGRLADLRAERGGLDRRVDEAAGRRDEALLVARCEYRPAPGCPERLITGDPGRGLEAEQARAALTGAGADLDAARTDRDRRAPGLDRDITATAARVEQERGAATRLAREDSGLVAHWGAMNDYTGAHPAAWLPRLAAIAALVLLLIAPLLLRLWRGTTEQDRLVEARLRRRQAERDADTAVAVRRAEVRAARELGLLDAGLLETGETGVLDAGVLDAEPVSVTGASATVRPALPAATAPAAEPRPSGTEIEPATTRNALDRLPGPLPLIGRTVGGIAGAFIPAPVARMAAARPRPLRMARTIWDEVEEFQFSVMRRRRVTVTEVEVEEPVDDRPTGVPGYLDVQQARAERLDGDRPDAERLGARSGPAGLDRGRRALPSVDDTD
jgi:hypothetical protein